MAKWSKCCCVAPDVDSPNIPNVPKSEKSDRIAGVTKIRKILLSNDDDIREDDLRSLMNFIEERVGEIGKREAGDSTVTVTTIANEANVYPDKINAILDAVSNPQYSQAITESNILLKDTLAGLGSLHWIGAGLSMVVFILNRVEQVGVNDAQCLTLLTDMRKLGRHVMDLFVDNGRDESVKEAKDEDVREAVQIIKQGAIWCDKFVRMGTFKRFVFATTNANSFEEIRMRIGLLYPTLTLTKVERIFEEMKKPAFAPKPKPPHNKVGLEERKEEILKILNMLDQSRTRAIVLHGIGGIGKSTLGNLVYHSLHETMDHHIKIEMKMKPEKNDFLEYQKDIIDSIIGDKEREKLSFPNLESGQTHLEKVLNNCKKKIFLYLDNVLDGEFLEKLFPENFTLSGKNIVVITSRESQLAIKAFLEAREVACDCYEVEELGRSEANTLFRGKFGPNGPPRDQQANFDKILQICGGLPLALEVIGGYLNSHGDAAWESVIESLGKFESISGSNEDRLMGTLEFSYQKLNSAHKSIFLDIACLLKEFSWDRLESIYGYNLFHLVERGLLKKMEVQGKGAEVKIHDLFLALAQAKEGGSRVVYEGDGGPVDYDQVDFEGVEGLVIRYCSMSPDQLDKLLTKTLRILILTNVPMWGHCTVTPRSLEVYVARGMRLGSPLQEFRDLEKLKILAIESPGPSKNRHHPLSSSPRIGIVPGLPLNLKVVDIQGVTVKGSLGKLGGALQELKITDCAMQQLPESVKKLESLRVLDITSNHGLEVEELPNSWGLGQSLSAALQRVTVKNCVNLKKLCDSFPPTSSLKYLNLSGSVGLETLGDGFGNLEQLQALGLRSCTNLASLPDGFGRLVSLSTLELSDWPKLESLPRDFGELRSLAKLGLSGCVRLTSLPEGFGKLMSLAELYMGGCVRMTSLPSEFCELGSLRVLSLRGCIELTSLPEDFGRLKSLQELHLEGCTNLESLPEGLGNLSSLSELRLEDCKKLKLLPGNIGELQSLTLLLLQECASLKSLPEGFGKLGSLTQLYMGECVALTSLPSSLCDLGSLRVLCLRGCIELSSLPNNFGKLSSLEELELRGCSELACLPEDLGNLASLRCLDIRSCVRLPELPSTFWNLKNLRDVNVTSCKLSMVGWEKVENQELVAKLRRQLTPEDASWVG